uniref:CPSF73-100_C domain-containing protein n=1 Tax=Parastrongyloides trichosuri TaxID=131310 RepID=A0A0N4ZMB2_PARTI
MVGNKGNANYSSKKGNRGNVNKNHQQQRRDDRKPREERNYENVVHSYYTRSFTFGFKKFYLDLYDFSDGKVLKLSEVFGDKQRISIHVPANALEMLIQKLDIFNDYHNDTESSHEPLQQSIVYKGQRFALLYGSNEKGPIVIISQVSKMEGTHSQIKVHPNNLPKLIEELTQTLCDINVNSQDVSRDNNTRYPSSGIVECKNEAKTFFIDPVVRNNEKCIRVSQLKLRQSSILMNTNIHIPFEDLNEFRDSLIQVIEELNNIRC